MKKAIHSRTIWVAILGAIGAGIAVATDAINAGQGLAEIITCAVFAVLRFLTSKPIGNEPKAIPDQE